MKMRKQDRVKIVLVHPPLKNIITAATPKYIDSNRGNTPPMGLLYIQAAIEKSKHESLFLDAQLDKLTHEETAKEALKLNPDIIGIQAMTFTMPDAYTVAKEIKKLNPECKIILGGPHPTIFPIETAKLEYIDYAFVGEGETRIVDFLNNFWDQDKISKIPGIASNINEKLNYIAEYNPYILNLDDINIPARESSDYMKYNSVISQRNPITIMITSRGCPYNCIFCNRMGRKYRYHSPGFVLNEFDDIARLNIKEVFIHDDTFSINRERIVKICNGLIKRNYDIIWEARTRVDCVDKELLKLMKEAGCLRLSFGVESGSEKVLKKMRKDIEIENVKQVFRYCKELGIYTLADIMVGNVDEDEEDIKKTYKLIRELNPDYLQISILSLYPGTPVYKMALQEKMIERDVWLDFAKNPQKDFSSPLWLKNFSKDDLLKITARGYRKFYMRPSFIWKQVKKLNSFSQLLILFKAAFGLIFRPKK